MSKVMAILVFALIVASTLLFLLFALPPDPRAAADVCHAPGVTSPQVRREVLDERRSVREAVLAARHRLGAPRASTPAVQKAARRELRRAQARLARWTAIPVSVDPKSPTSFLLGRDVNLGERSIKFATDEAVPGGRRTLAVEVGQFVPKGSGPEFASDVVEAWATLRSDRTGGTLYLCIPPAVRLSAPNGVFDGTIALTDPRLSRLDVPVSLSLAYPRIDRVAETSIAVSFVASLYVYLIRRDSYLVPSTAAASAPPTQPPTQPPHLSFPRFLSEYGAFCVDSLGILTLIIGGIAAFGAFTTQYLNSEDWGGVGAWATLIGAVATAFITGATAGKLAQSAFPLAHPPTTNQGVSQTKE